MAFPTAAAGTRRAGEGAKVAYLSELNKLSLSVGGSVEVFTWVTPPPVSFVFPCGIVYLMLLMLMVSHVDDDAP